VILRSGAAWSIVPGLLDGAARGLLELDLARRLQGVLALAGHFLVDSRRLLLEGLIFVRLMIVITVVFVIHGASKLRGFVRIRNLW
jgi:hypothetical protein